METLNIFCSPADSANSLRCSAMLERRSALDNKCALSMRFDSSFFGDAAWSKMRAACFSVRKALINFSAKSFGLTCPLTSSLAATFSLSALRRAALERGLRVGEPEVGLGCRSATSDVEARSGLVCRATGVWERAELVCRATSVEARDGLVCRAALPFPGAVDGLVCQAAAGGARAELVC